MDIGLPTEIQYIMRQENAAIYMKRDDLIPFSFGGNKVRIAAELIKDMKGKGADLIISYGSASSNLNRAAAEMAAAEGIKCCVIIKKETPEISGGEALPSGGAADAGRIPLNERLVREAGAKVIYCTAENVKETVAKTLSEARKVGFHPYYVYGDSLGKGNDAALIRAYKREFSEILLEQQEKGINFRHIFVAVGTGATISGLLAGAYAAYGDGSLCPVIHGISVARDRAKVKRDIIDRLSSAGEPGSLLKDLELGVIKCEITDRYLDGGYGVYSEETADEIRAMFARGIALDPIYSAKAWRGMISEILSRGICGACLFIHTGGLPVLIDKADELNIEISQTY